MSRRRRRSEPEPIVALEFAGCAADEASRALAMQTTHDNLIAHYPERLGPVEWHFYNGADAVEKLRLAGLDDDPRAVGLIAWLAADPHAELLIASVPVPAAAARLASRLTANDVLERVSARNADV